MMNEQVVNDAQWDNAMSGGGDAIASFWQTAAAYNEGRASSEAFNTALRAMDAQEPATYRDFLRKFIAMHADDGTPNDDRQAALFAAAQRLLGEV